VAAAAGVICCGWRGVSISASIFEEAFPQWHQQQLAKSNAAIWLAAYENQWLSRGIGVALVMLYRERSLAIIMA